MLSFAILELLQLVIFILLTLILSLNSLECRIYLLDLLLPFEVNFGYHLAQPISLHRSYQYFDFVLELPYLVLPFLVWEHPDQQVQDQHKHRQQHFLIFSMLLQDPFL
jgi:hypothetical protein